MKRSAACLVVLCLILVAGPAQAREILFLNVTTQVGIPDREQRSWGVTWTDYDRDGFPDLLLGRHLRWAWLFKNLNGSYVQLAEAALRKPAPGRHHYDRHSCAWGEANGDGLPDLYCASGAQKGVGTGPNQLLLQTPAGLVDRTKKYGAVDLFGRGRSVNWLDHDSDGDLDLFVGNEIRAGYPNVFFRNDGDHFTPVDVGFSQEISTVNSTWADWDNDGDPDLVVMSHGSQKTLTYENMGGRFHEVDIPGLSGREWRSAAWADYDGDGWIDVHLVSRWRATLLRNIGGRFEAVHQMDVSTGRMSAWLDAENDGDLDLFVVQGRPTRDQWGTANNEDLMLVQRAGRFAPLRREFLKGPATGNGESVAVADHDRDGLQDLFITNGYSSERGESELLQNASRGGAWAALVLIGDPRNPFAYGAKVKVRTSERTFWRFLTDGANFRAQSEGGYVHLGLNESKAAAFRVVWPDGSITRGSVKAGQIMPVLKAASIGCQGTDRSFTCSGKTVCGR